MDLKVAIMGTGGVGGYFGTRLALAGHDVHFIARGRHLDAIRAQGLTVRSPLGDMHLPTPSITDHPADIGPVDVVLLGVKLWDTETAALAIRLLVGPGTAVISLQNGVVKDEMLRAALGEAAVVGGVCYIAATIAAPGVIAHQGTLQKLVFGEYGGQRSQRVEAFRQACEQAGIEAVVSEDIARAIWEKFVFLVGLSGATASTRCAIGPIRSHPDSRRLLWALMAEAVAVGRAEGVALPPDYAENRLAFCDQLPADMTASMLRDLLQGHRLELPWLSGDVSRRGALLNVATPYNSAVADILALHVQPG